MQTKELAFKEYHTFIESAECSKSIKDELRQLGGALDSTVGGVAGLAAALTRCVDVCR